MRRTDPGLEAGRARSDRVAKAAASTRRGLAADAAAPKPARRRSAALGAPTDLARRRSATAAATGPDSPAPNPPGGSPDDVASNADTPGPAPQAMPWWRPGGVEATLPPDGGELHRGVLTSGAADQLAALVARAAHAPAGPHPLRAGQSAAALRRVGTLDPLGGRRRHPGRGIARRHRGRHRRAAGDRRYRDRPAGAARIPGAGGRHARGIPRATRSATGTARCSASAAPSTPSRANGRPSRSPPWPRRPRSAPC